MGSTLRVVGVGSPHGDDRVGWWLADRLAGGSRAGVEVVRAATPLDLIDDLDGVGTLIVADAVRGGGGPRGSVVIRRWPDEADLGAGRDGSTHGLGVVEALSLAVALGRLPGRVILFGIEAGDNDDDDEARSGKAPDGDEGRATLWASALSRLEGMLDPMALREETGR
jgi:hydrogenase maturation protease